MTEISREWINHMGQTATILLTDWGHTALKVALFNKAGQCFIWQSSFPHSRFDGFAVENGLADSVEHLPTAMRAAAAVAQQLQANKRQLQLKGWLHSSPSPIEEPDPGLAELSLNLEENLGRSLPQPHRVGIKELTTLVDCSAYQTGQLGLDRALALVAAKVNYPDEACIVLDAGTATTLDCLSEDGRFLGGLILPGLEAYHSALPQSVKKLAPYYPEAACLFDDSTQLSGLGLSTENCLKQGVELGYSHLLGGCITKQVSSLKLEGFTVNRVVITGGNATKLLSAIKATAHPLPVSLLKEGVLSGLACFSLHMS